MICRIEKYCIWIKIVLSVLIQKKCSLISKVQETLAQSAIQTSSSAGATVPARVLQTFCKAYYDTQRVNSQQGGLCQRTNTVSKRSAIGGVMLRVRETVGGWNRGKEGAFLDGGWQNRGGSGLEGPGLCSSILPGQNAQQGAAWTYSS